MLNCQGKNQIVVLSSAGLLAATAAAVMKPDALAPVMLATAALVVVPLAVGFCVSGVVAAVVFAISLVVPQGPAAGALSAVWVLWCVGYALRRRSLPAAYLVVGAGWALIDRLGADPSGLGGQIVELTAVHFHYAGFAAATLAAAAWERNGAPLAVPALVLAGPPLVAAGFTAWIGFQLVGATVLTAGMLGVAWWTRADPSIAIRAAGVCVVGGMALALAYAAGNVLGFVVLPMDTMARTHGLLNGAGFTILGLAGRARQVRSCGGVSRAGEPWPGVAASS